MLQPFLLHLRDSKRLAKIHPQLLDILRSNLRQDQSKNMTLASVEGLQDIPMDVLRQLFRTSLTTNLFGWDELLSLRMRLALADFSWVCYSRPALFRR